MSARWAVVMAALIAVVLGGLVAQASPPASPGTMRDPYTISDFAPAPADGQLVEHVRTCNPGDVVTGVTTRFIADAQTWPEFPIASRMEVNDPSKATVWWRNNPVGGLDGTVEVDVRCAVIG